MKSPLEFVLTIALATLGGATASAAVEPRSTDEIVQANNEFTWQMYGQLSEVAGKKNLVFSPVSIRSAFSQVFLGTVGATKTELARALGFESNSPRFHLDSAQLATELATSRSYNFESANKSWIAQTFHLLPEFKADLKKYYATEFALADFEKNRTNIAREINDWVKQQTHGKISELVTPSSFDRTSRLVLINAVYFKAEWEKPFNVRATKPGNFFPAEGPPVKATFMADQVACDWWQDAQHTLVAIPYKNSEADFVALMPAAETNLATFTAHYTSAQFAADLAKLHRGEVDITLPKFKLNFGTSLNASLQRMGVSAAFAPSAEFPGISKENIYISEAIHKAIIEVDEKGTVAAAVTGVSFKGSVILQHPHAKFDRPFLFFVRDRKTGILLFAGQFNSPAG